MREHDDGCRAVKPTRERHHFLEAVATHHQIVDALEELTEAVILSLKFRLGKPINPAIASSDESIEASRDKHGSFHAGDFIAWRQELEAAIDSKRFGGQSRRDESQ